MKLGDVLQYDLIIIYEVNGECALKRAHKQKFNKN